MEEMEVLRTHVDCVKIEHNARKVNIVYSLYAHILFDCSIVSGLSDTTKRRHRGRNKGLDVERFIIENLGKKLSVTFNEGKTYRAIVIRTPTSTTTLAHVSRILWIHHSHDGICSARTFEIRFGTGHAIFFRL